MSPLEDAEAFAPFAILIRSRSLILVPALLAKRIPSYQTFFASLHANKEFCEMGFGQGFLARSWNVERPGQVLIGPGRETPRWATLLWAN